MMKSTTNSTMKRGVSVIGTIPSMLVVAIFLFGVFSSISQTHIFSPEEQQLNDSYALADMETIRTFVRKVIDEPLSSNYAIPSYIIESKDAEEASKVVGTYYPEFYGKQGLELLDAVKTHTAVYVRMIKEYKAIRLLFEPTN
jgi:hypothetical protein